MINNEQALNHWISLIGSEISSRNVALLPIFDIYAAEAVFANRFLSGHLASLPPNATILEVGAGSLLLSSFLTSRGFLVTALEPIGSGFGHFGEIQRHVMQVARRQGHLPSVLSIPVEELTETQRFDFAFSINVMEHVGEPVEAIRRILNSLKPQGTYSFICPNYTFPYEPHFNIPILWNKKITQTFFHKQIYSNSKVYDADGLWNSLNWISIELLKKNFNDNQSIKIKFKESIFSETLERVLADKHFAERRSKLIVAIVKLVVKLKMHHIFDALPLRWHPMISCEIIRL